MVMDRIAEPAPILGDQNHSSPRAGRHDRPVDVAPGYKDKTRYTLYVSPGSQISHIATIRVIPRDNTYYITY